VSSAARDVPRCADDLPALTVATMMVGEAAPDPPPGPVREALAVEAVDRIDRAVDLMTAVITAYNTRLAGVVTARLRSPKTRRGTRWWADSTKIMPGTGDRPLRTSPDLAVGALEVKALDAGYILPDRHARDELADALRPVGLRIVAEAASSMTRALRRPNIGLSVFDHRHIEQAVQALVSRMLEINERHARDIRREILSADATAESLDATVGRVLEATRRGGRWLLLAGRTLAAALAGDAALAAARALGVTYTQWVSRRDGRVREAHTEADGQTRPVGTPFLVGGFRLRFPSDPSGLPASAPVVYGCRCGLIFMPPDAQRSKAIRLAERGTPAAARSLLDVAARQVTPARTVLSAPELARSPAFSPESALPRPDMSARRGPVYSAGGSPLLLPEIAAPADTVGYRVLDALPDVVPGQRISWPGALAFGLAAPVASAVTLAVVLAAGTQVGVGAGVVVLPAGAQLEVVAVEAERVVARPVE
jgi:hypothetical protein